jgi:type IV secretory pathway TrbD component
MDLRRLPIHRALHRPHLLLGAEREPVLYTLIVAFTLVFAALSWPALLVGAALWLVGLGVLRSLAKADPHMTRVYLRHIRYRPYYPARSTPFRRP